MSPLAQCFLDHIVVVMVNTTLPANIGSAARAMHTMGLTNLVVVAPKYPIDENAIAYSAGASHILHQAKIASTLETAIADCHWILATSSRQRHMPQPLISPRQASELLWSQFTAIAKNTPAESLPKVAPKIALVFGREDRGLTNEELQLAQYHIQIPANPDYSVLNVAAAVQVIASVFFEQAMTKGLENELQSNIDSSLDNSLSKNTIAIFPRQDWDAPPITQAQKALLEQQLLEIMAKYQLFDPSQPKLLPARLARLASRLQLDEKEFELLQSILVKLQHANRQ